MKILFCGMHFPEAPRALQKALPPGDEVISCTADEVHKSLVGVDVLVPSMTRIDAQVLDAGNLHLVQQFATGVENIDLEVARAHGIPVANIPASSTGNAKAVAELALLHLLAVLRCYQAAGKTLSAGQLGVPVGASLMGKRVVVLGLGAVGTEVVKRLRPFEVRLVGVSRRSWQEVRELTTALGIHEYHDLSRRLDALAGAEAAIVCLRQGPGMEGIVGTREIGIMASGAVLVNVARGALVDYDALHEGLVSGRLLGAGLDVFWEEPVDPKDPLLKLNVSVTPHVGGVTKESYEMMAAAAAENINRLRAGQPLMNRVA